MSEPQLHHYVPQFYLRRFADESGNIWVWERDRDRCFPTKPHSVAAEKNFYRIPELTEQNLDPLLLEKHFAQLEDEVAKITSQWLDWLRTLNPGDKIEVPEINRELVSLYLALQFFRTADLRDILAAFAKSHSNSPPLSVVEKQQLHLELLWNSDIYRELAARIKAATWLFGRNGTSIPFISSDNPLAFRTADNSMWMKVAVYETGTYSVFPIAPDLVLYCHPREGRWENSEFLDCCLSPVRFTEEMVESENIAQVFMATRFVISQRNDFEREREFAKTIGTDTYKPYWTDRRDERGESEE